MAQDQPGAQRAGRNLREVGSRIEQLLDELGSVDPSVKARAEELVRLLVELYGAGLARVVELTREQEPARAELLGRMAADPLVESLLVLHGLHPEPVEARIRQALDQVRPYLGSHAGGVEFLGVDAQGVVRLRLEGSCHGCPSSTVTVKLAIERAVEEAAPEVTRIDVEGLTAAPAPPNMIPAESLFRDRDRDRDRGGNGDGDRGGDRDRSRDRDRDEDRGRDRGQDGDGDRGRDLDLDRGRDRPGATVAGGWVALEGLGTTPPGELREVEAAGEERRGGRERGAGMSELVFECLDARPERYAAVPTMVLRLRLSEVTGERVHAVALRCQIRIEPYLRRYGPQEAERLADLFGETSRWSDTLKPLQFTNLSLMVQGFSGSTEVDLPVPCTYDFEVVSAKYLHSLDDGEVPLLLLFSGTVFLRGETGFSVEQVPWHKEATFRLPVRVWRETMDLYFPNSAWIRLRRDSLDALRRFQTPEALPSWDDALETLLKRAAERRSGGSRTASEAVAPGSEGGSGGSSSKAVAPGSEGEQR